jgi:hypothetical protein
MSGAVAAHAAYNGSGTQGLAVTNKIHDDDGDVMSVFWNKNDTTRQLLYGSSMIEIPSSAGSGTQSLQTPITQIFDVNNDIDCLGDMVLKVSADLIGEHQIVTGLTGSLPGFYLNDIPYSMAPDFLLITPSGTPANKTYLQASFLAVPGGAAGTGLRSDFADSSNLVGGGTIDWHIDGSANYAQGDTFTIANTASGGVGAVGTVHAVDGSGKILTWFISNVGSGYLTASNADGSITPLSVASGGAGGSLTLTQVQFLGGGAAFTTFLPLQVGVGYDASATITVKYKIPGTSTYQEANALLGQSLNLTTATNIAYVGPQELSDLISRVEVQVGTQIWQTFENADLLALSATELSSGSFNDYCFQSSGGVQNASQFTNDEPFFGGFVMPQTDQKVTAYIPLKMMTKTLGPRLENFAEQTESGYLMAAAPHQQVKVKVYTRGTTADGGLLQFTTASTSSLSLSLYGENIVMCNEEREQMKAMPMGLPKRIKMTQNASKKTTSAGQSSVEFDLDHFSLYTSHLIITVQVPVEGFHADITGAYAELLLNSSSFSGKLPLGLLKMTASASGLFTNEYTISNVNHSSYLTFVFPLASKAYGGSSVPLNRFDNIRLKITGLPGSSSSNPLPSHAEFNITCVGETTALYKGGAASLAMY